MTHGNTLSFLSNPRDEENCLSPTPWWCKATQKAGLLTCSQAIRLPENLSGLYVLLKKGTYSCGTVEDSHLIPFSSLARTFCTAKLRKVERKTKQIVFFLPRRSNFDEVKVRKVERKTKQIVVFLPRRSNFDEVNVRINERNDCSLNCSQRGNKLFPTWE